MSRLAKISSSPMLKEYAQGAAQDATNPVADFLAPTVDVATSVGKFKAYTEKNRFHLPDTRRAIGGRATEIRFDAEDKTYNCTPHALDYPVDYLEQLETEGMENMVREGAVAIAEIAALAHEVTVINAALAAVGDGTGKVWKPNEASGSTDPVADLDEAILSVIKTARYGSAMGVGVLFGATAFSLFKNAYLIRKRFKAGGNQYTQGEDVSKLLIGTPDVRISYMVQDTAPAGIADNIGFVLDSSVLIFARKANPTRRDPSFMKTFRLMGQWMVPGSYVREDGRAEVAKFDWSEDVQVTNSAACVRLNPAAS